MAVAAHTIPPSGSIWTRIRYGTLCVELVVGFLYIALNFPHMLHRLTHPTENEAAIFSPLVDWIQAIVQITMARLGSHAFFQMPNIVALLFVEIVIYLGLGVLLSVRTSLSPITILSAGKATAWRPHMVIGPMLGGLFAGFIGMHVAAWLVIVTIFLLTWIFYIVAIVISFFAGLFAAIGRFFLGLLISIWSLFGWWLLLPVMIVLGILLLRRQFNLRWLMMLLLGALGLGVLFVVLPPILRFLVRILQAIAEFLLFYVVPLIRVVVVFVLWVAIFLIKVGGGIALLSFLGRLLIDQFRASATACDGPKGTFLGAFGIGSAVTLIFLGTVFQPDLAGMLDQGWGLAWQWLAGWSSGTEGPAIAYLPVAALYRSVMPEWLSSLGSTWLSNRSIPLFDMLAALLILAMSCFVFCAQILKSDVDVDAQLASFFQSQLLRNFGLYFVAVLLLILQGLDDNS